MSEPLQSDAWRKPEPKIKRRRAVERDQHDDLGLEVGQVWKHKGLPYLPSLQRELTVERICRRSVMGPIIYVFRNGERGFARDGQVSFLKLRREWHLVGANTSDAPDVEAGGLR